MLGKRLSAVLMTVANRDDDRNGSRRWQGKGNHERPF